MRRRRGWGASLRHSGLHPRRRPPAPSEGIYLRSRSAASQSGSPRPQLQRRWQRHPGPLRSGQRPRLRRPPPRGWLERQARLARPGRQARPRVSLAVASRPSAASLDRQPAALFAASRKGVSQCLILCSAQLSGTFAHDTGSLVVKTQPPNFAHGWIREADCIESDLQVYGRRQQGFDAFYRS